PRCARVSAIDKRKPSGRAPLPARSERLIRSAFLATLSGGSSGKKCTPAITPSAVSTNSRPGGTVTTAASSTSPSAPGCVASGRKCRAISRSSAEPREVFLRTTIGEGYALGAPPSAGRGCKLAGAKPARQRVEHGVDHAGLLAVDERVGDADIFR